MRPRLLISCFALAFTACASTSMYKATSPSQARVRFVAQGPGNVYFAVPKALECNKKFGSALDDGDQLVAVLQGVTNPYPKFGSPPVIGMPDAKRHPEWTFLETPMDAGREVPIRATVVSSNGSPYDVSMCNTVLAVNIDAGKDCEIVMASQARECKISVVELGSGSASPQVTRTELKPAVGPRACSRN